MPGPQHKEFDWFDKPRNIARLWKLLWTACGLSVALGLFGQAQPHFGFDGVFGFFALLGFVSCAALILLAKGLGYLLKRPVDYYDR